MSTRVNPVFSDKKLIFEAAKSSFLKLNPLSLIKNPVIFIVAIGSVITTVLLLFEILSGNFSIFNLQISIWLWFTVLFANFVILLFI